MKNVEILSVEIRSISNVLNLASFLVKPNYTLESNGLLLSEQDVNDYFFSISQQLNRIADDLDSIGLLEGVTRHA